MIAFDDVIQGV